MYLVHLKKNDTEVKILIRCAKGDIVYIPKISMIISDYLFEFKRLQFPINLCFVITINKAQGQTLKITSSDNTDSYFIHGQFYVAYPRVSSKIIYIYICS